MVLTSKGNPSEAQAQPGQDSHTTVQGSLSPMLCRNPTTLLLLAFVSIGWSCVTRLTGATSASQALLLGILCPSHQCHHHHDIPFGSCLTPQCHLHHEDMPLPGNPIKANKKDLPQGFAPRLATAITEVVPPDFSKPSPPQHAV
jgi:hypothetical protein